MPWLVTEGPGTKGPHPWLRPHTALDESSRAVSTLSMHIVALMQVITGDVVEVYGATGSEMLRFR